MKRRIIILTTLLVVCFTHISFGQSNKQKALDKGLLGIKMIDQGKIEEGIKLFEEAQDLDPERIDYPYEIAYAKYQLKDYEGAIKIIKKFINHKDITDRHFQMLGNCYDILGKSEKALETYKDGIKKFSNAGNLYLESGNVYWGKKDYTTALPFYEKGIELDPSFPSNYYRAARIYCASNEVIWGLMYGEIFMNLEKNSERTAEISKLLYDTYKSKIIIKNDSSLSVHFVNKININSSSFSDGKSFKMPFSFFYETNMSVSTIGEKEVTLNSIDKIRQSFTELYFKTRFAKEYPNMLFDFQNDLKKLGHLEAYNHWLLMKGDEKAFDSWLTNNKSKYDNFLLWFNDNKIKLSLSNRLYQGQY
jgi:tetratricopeptide (TPR) repeat protein